MDTARDQTPILLKHDSYFPQWCNVETDTDVTLTDWQTKHVFYGILSSLKTVWWHQVQTHDDWNVFSFYRNCNVVPTVWTGQQQRHTGWQRGLLFQRNKKFYQQHKPEPDITGPLRGRVRAALCGDTCPSFLLFLLLQGDGCFLAWRARADSKINN